MRKSSQKCIASNVVFADKTVWEVLAVTVGQRWTRPSVLPLRMVIDVAQ